MEKYKLEKIANTVRNYAVNELNNDIKAFA